MNVIPFDEAFFQIKNGKQLEAHKSVNEKKMEFFFSITRVVISTNNFISAFDYPNKQTNKQKTG